MAVQKSSQGNIVSLVNLPATARQRRLVFALAGVLFAAFLVSAPFATLPQRRFDSFIPSIEAIIFVNDFITSVLLFTQYSIVRFSRHFSARKWIPVYGIDRHSACAHFSRRLCPDRSSGRWVPEHRMVVLLLAYWVSLSGAFLRIAQGCKSHPLRDTAFSRFRDWLERWGRHRSCLWAHVGCHNG